MLEVLTNPSCSKCRQALKLLDSLGRAYRVRQYLEDPLTLDELRQLRVKLGRPPREWMREVVGSTEDEQLRSIAERPELMQRPILVAGDRAVVGRTAEAVRSLLEAP